VGQLLAEIGNISSQITNSPKESAMALAAIFDRSGWDIQYYGVAATELASLLGCRWKVFPPEARQELADAVTSWFIGRDVYAHNAATISPLTKFIVEIADDRTVAEVAGQLESRIDDGQLSGYLHLVQFCRAPELNTQLSSQALGELASILDRGSNDDSRMALVRLIGRVVEGAVVALSVAALHTVVVPMFRVSPVAGMLAGLSVLGVVVGFTRTGYDIRSRDDSAARLDRRRLAQEALQELVKSLEQPSIGA
jgi:hypothetical protein